MHKVLEEIGKIGIVPVIKIDDAQKAIPLANAILSGGIPCIEITFRTAQGEEAIRRISAEVPGILLGAGTVLTVDQVDRAVKAGAKFIVTPGFNPKVVSHCVEKGIPVTPGCSCPSDIEQALEFSLEVVKFFPAEQSGGIEYIKAVSAAYPNLKFMPTGGINAGNIGRYMAFEKIHACGGSWMASADLINSGNFEKITALSREAVMNVLGFHVAHMGINAGDNETALKTAKHFNTLFGFQVKDGSTSTFASDEIEIMKEGGLGVHGHIGIGTNNLMRAVSFMERNGISVDYNNTKKDQNGKVFLIYLKDEILGFAVHLIQ